MPPEKTSPEKKKSLWMLPAVIILLLLVLTLQLWQIFGGGRPGGRSALTQDAASDPADTSPGASVSPGKTALIEAIRAQNGDLSAEALSALTTVELEQLWETGAPGLPIGLSAAAQAAEAYAGTTAIDSVTWDADPELNGSPAYYQVELHHITLGDLPYQIDAYTGEVLEGRANLFGSVPDAPLQENSGDGKIPALQAEPPASGAPEPQASDSGNSGGLITEEAARAAAFAHAGVDGADAGNLRVKLDWEDGVQVYEIEFRCGGEAYEYEIEASTGAVRKAGQTRGVAGRQGGSQQSGDFIGEDAAGAAALAHAGVSPKSAEKLRTELDQEDGRWIYEVEFRAEGVEYEYEIDAATGETLKASQER